MLLCLTYLIPYYAYALTCSHQDIRNLSAPGGSLYPLRSTNQNGLGICHIEQLHKMLKARLPGHPDFSRIQLAIAEKQNRDKNLLVKKAVRWRGAAGIGGTYVDAGVSCDAFNHIKGQYICPSKSDRFEQITKQNPANQEKIIETLSAYFDERQGNNYLSGLRIQGLDTISFHLDAALEDCSPGITYLSGLRRSFESYLAKNRMSLNFNHQLLSTRLKNLKDSDFTIKTSDLESGLSYESHLKKILTSNPNFVFTGPGGIELNQQIQFVAAAMKTNETCVSKKAQEYMSPLCISSIGNTAKDVIGLAQLGLTLQEVLKILKGSWDRDEFFRGVFACQGLGIMVPQNLSCRDVDTLTLAHKAKSQLDYQQQAATLVDAKLAKGIPVGISVCTRFFTNPSSKLVKAGSTDFSCGDKKDTGYKAGEGSHAVTIIGSRCKNGQHEYLVQNSWGNGCFYSKDFECTKKGGFWAPADVILNNTRRLSILD